MREMNDNERLATFAAGCFGAWRRASERSTG